MKMTILLLSFIVSFTLMISMVSAQVNIGGTSNNTKGVIIYYPTTSTSSGGGTGANVSSVSSGDSFIAVSPTTGDVIVSLTNSATQWLYNQTTGAINYVDGVLALNITTINNRVNSINTTVNIQNLLNSTNIYSTFNATYNIWAYNQTIKQNPFNQELNTSSNVQHRGLEVVNDTIAELVLRTNTSTGYKQTFRVRQGTDLAWHWGTAADDDQYMSILLGGGENRIMSTTRPFRIYGITESSPSIYANVVSQLVGIATASPTTTLEVNGNASINNSLFVNTNGKVGIGTTTPNASLDVNSNVFATNNFFGVGTNATGYMNNGDIYLKAQSNADNTHQAIKFIFGTGGNTATLINQSGDVFSIQTHTTNTQSPIGRDVIIQPYTGNVCIGTGGSCDTVFQVRESSTATTTAGIYLTQASTGDAVLHYELEGTRFVSTGLDNSDGDKYKISHSSTLGSNDLFVIDTSGNLNITGKIYQQGCRSGFTRTGLGCIQTDEQGSGIFNTSVDNCYTTYKARIPTIEEYYAGYKEGMLNADDDDEWLGVAIGLAVQGAYFDASASSSVEPDDVSTQAFSVSTAYRCFIPFGGGA